MSSGPTGWLPFILTTFGAGVAGSVIATYGSQSSERRKARAKALNALLAFEIARQEGDVLGLDADAYETQIGQLQARFVLTGLPLKIFDLYVTAIRSVHFPITKRDTAAERLIEETGRALGNRLIYESLSLIRQSIWHPWLSVILGRSLNARRIRKTLVRVYPGVLVVERSTSVAVSSFENAIRAYGLECGARLRPTRQERRIARVMKYIEENTRAAEPK
jgi:hypothetical protein